MDLVLLPAVGCDIQDDFTEILTSFSMHYIYVSVHENIQSGSF